MERSLNSTVIAALGGALGVAATLFGEADDAPGLVLLGLLIVGGAVVFGVRPALRTRPRVIGFIIGAMTFTAVFVGVAGWLEDTF